MKRKQTRSVKTTPSAAAARRPARKPASKPPAPKPARPPAKRKTAAKKKTARRAPAARAPRARKAAPAPAAKKPARRPKQAAPAPQTLTSGFEQVPSPPPTLSTLVRQAQAAQPLPPLPPEPPPARPAAPPPPAQQPLPIPPILLEGDERTQPVEPGPVEKFVLGPTPPPEPEPVQENVLPETYGTGKLFLTARDPHSLYAHWDFTQAQQRRYSAFAHHLALRVYQQHLEGGAVAETAVEPETRHAFVQVSCAGASYVAQLGCYQPGGQWLALAVSEPAATPPETVAEDKTVRWAAVSPLVSAPETAQEAGRAVPEHREGPSGLNGAGLVAHNGAPEPSALPERLPTPQMQASQPEGAAPAPGPAPHFQMEPAPAPLSVAPTPSWTPAQERALAEMIEVALGQTRTVGSVEIAELAQRRHRREIGAPAAQPGASLPPGLSLPLGGQASLPVPVESQPLGISSAPGAAPPGPARPFWFNLNVEVVVYGATEPNARVTLGGQPVRLRPDGTFSARFSLPDGVYDLAATAVSVDDDTRRADLRLGRRTDYQGEVGVHPQDKALRPPTPENVLQAVQAK